MNHKLTGIIAVAAVAALGAAACSSTAKPGASSGSKTPTGKPLTIVTTGISPMTDNFNPFDQTDTGFESHAEDLYDLPLAVYDTQRPTQAPIPYLATGESWSNGGKTLTITTRSGVKWSDGKPFSAADVAFTFGLLAKYPAANAEGTPLPVSETGSGNTATLTFAQPEYANLYLILQEPIVPQHIWSSVTDPATYTWATPVGTGPYVLDQFSSTGYTMKVNPDYYAKSSLKVPELDFPSYGGNANLLQPIADGTIDWGGIDITGTPTNYLAKSTANNTWSTSAPYYSANNVVSLMFNVTVPPLNDPKVREAISYAIDRQQLSVDGESNNEQVATTTAGLLPADSSYLEPSLANNLPATGDSAKVSQILSGDGYTKVGGYWEKGGKKISFSIEDPTTYGDYWTDAGLIVTQLKKDGIDASTKGDAGTNGPTIWTADLESGHFDSAIHWSQQGLTPYGWYDPWMDYRLSAPVGKTAAFDWGRFDDPAAQSALNAYTAASTPAEQAAAITSLENIMNTETPVAPLLNGASWAQFSTRNYTGWPTASNPYMDPGPNPPEILYTVTQLTPVS
jgi:peptide/nickel transport system substrate-binding protein